jgi:hypothetical protein
MDGQSIIDAAKGRFDTQDYVYRTQKGGESTTVGAGISIQTGKNNGVITTGIGVDCSNLVYQSLLSAGYNVDYLSILC